MIGRFPGEQSCLSLCWAVLDLIISHSNKVRFTELDLKALERIKRERIGAPDREEVIAA